MDKTPRKCDKNALEKAFSVEHYHMIYEMFLAKSSIFLLEPRERKQEINIYKTKSTFLKIKVIFLKLALYILHVCMLYN